jgi:hypothetical protein
MSFTAPHVLTAKRKKIAAAAAPTASSAARTDYYDNDSRVLSIQVASMAEEIRNQSNQITGLTAQLKQLTDLIAQLKMVERREAKNKSAR